MNKRLITTFVIVAFVLGTNYGQKNDKVNITNLATEIVDKLEKDATLTKEQRKALLKKTEEYVLKMLDANALSDKKQLFEAQKKAFESYNAVLDSTLTKKQKTQRETKLKERGNQENTK